MVPEINYYVEKWINDNVKEDSLRRFMLYHPRLPLMKRNLAREFHLLQKKRGFLDLMELKALCYNFTEMFYKAAKKKRDIEDNRDSIKENHDDSIEQELKELGVKSIDREPIVK